MYVPDVRGTFHLITNYGGNQCMKSEMPAMILKRKVTFDDALGKRGFVICHI